jgi:tetratricopeptide (TPR) repeat protein
MNVLIRRAYHLAIRMPGLGQLFQQLRNVYRRLKGKPRITEIGGREIELLPAMPDRARYDALATLNAVTAVRRVTADLHDRLGIDQRRAAVPRTVQHVHDALAAGIDLEQARRDGSTLVRFEAAWALYQAGRIEPALQTFGALSADEGLLARARHSAYARDAVVRSAEIVGRHAERAGDLDAALSLYERVVRAGGGGAVARRLTELLWRAGRTHEAAALAERALRSDHDLASQATKDDAHVTRAADLLARAGAPPPTPDV